VNATIILATLRQRFTSPMRLVLLAMFLSFSMMPILLSPAAGFMGLGACYWYALVLAAGAIGQDLSSGTLQLLLARPVTRAQYVFSRWAALSAGTLLVVLLQVVVAAPLLVLRGASPPWHELPLLLANDALEAMGMVSVMTLLSTLVPGIGDLGLLALAFISAQVMEGIGGFKGWAALVRAAEELQHALKPSFDLAPLFQGVPVSWLELVSYLSTVTLCLAIAVMVLNRRELSYASSDG
jgi:ABC-type transport system involved in multi-copper enzyme maturation permease subunit